MPVLGLQLMMLKDQINEKGMYEVLRQVRDLDIDAVEVSQVEMTDELIDDLVRGKEDFGVETAAMSASLAPGGNGFALETEFDRAAEACRRAQFAEVGQGNMNWPALLPAAEKASAEYFLIEQDDTYGRDPIDCIRESREYLRSIGY